jgi:hypothetical protein
LYEPPGADRREPLAGPASPVAHAWSRREDESQVPGGGGQTDKHGLAAHRPPNGLPYSVSRAQPPSRSRDRGRPAGQRTSEPDFHATRRRCLADPKRRIARGACSSGAPRCRRLSSAPRAAARAYQRRSLAGTTPVAWPSSVTFGPRACGVTDRRSRLHPEESRRRRGHGSPLRARGPGRGALGARGSPRS